ncbi:MAG: GNAT family N-acetyltransferase, partial [Phocaeicola sp.]|nr:GNAT family N-acetyltransferase [Phocaeicola sp.]
MMDERHLQKNGLRLRAPEPEDLEVMFRFENATDVWEGSNTTGPYSCFQLRQYIEQTRNDLFT